jgi:hypothetical protein
MGALTLKSFPFELRGWDIEKFESLDPTDGFGRITRVYISNQQIVQIEPEFSINSNNNWFSDKGRQFFDGIFRVLNENKESSKPKTKNSWKRTFKTLLRIFYLFDHCTNKQKQKFLFTILFENVGIEVLSLLLNISRAYSFIHIKRSENVKLNNDLENSFQINSGLNEKRLGSSSLALLIGTNPRYESYSLNLELRQRFLKGNFKCLTLGSLTNLTFPNTFTGTNCSVLKTITEGNNLICQDLKVSKNPIFVFNSSLFKRTDGKDIFRTFKILKYSNLFNRAFVGFHVLNSSIHETGVYSITHFESLELKDLNRINSLYLINTTLENSGNVKKLTESKLLNLTASTNAPLNSLVIDQNYYQNNNLAFIKTNLLDFSTYFHIPAKMFYENNETVVTTQGIVRHTSKLISRRNSIDNWKLLRNFLITTKKYMTFVDQKNNCLATPNLKNRANFKSYIGFNYHAVEKLDNSGFMLTNKNTPFYLNKKFTTFKYPKVKLIATKLKYWLDDFFLGGKDDYSQRSLVLANCSRIIRNQSTNFF